MHLLTARYTMPLLEKLIKSLTFDHEKYDDSKYMHFFTGHTQSVWKSCVSPVRM